MQKIKIDPNVLKRGEKKKDKITNERQDLIRQFVENTYIHSKGSEYVHPDPIVIAVQLKDWSVSELRDLLKDCLKAKNFAALFWFKVKEQKKRKWIKIQ